MMNKTFLLLAALLLSCSSVFAQKSDVKKAASALSSGDLEEAYTLIEQTIDPNNEKAEKSIPWETTWDTRGDIYLEIYKTGSDLAENPLETAIESYKTAIEKNGKGGSNNTKVKLTLAISEISNKAIEAFNTDDYESAYYAFKNILTIEDLPLMQEDGAFVDTVSIFNTGLAAQNAEMYDEAIKYYERAAEYNYGEGQVYDQIATCYTNLNDTVAAIETLKKGFEKYPESNEVMVSLINMYLSTNKADEASTYLDIAIAKEPENATYRFVKGTLYDTMGEYEEAITHYEEALEIDSEYHDAYYNIGVIYYNLGVKQLDIANAVPTNDPDKYEEEKAKADIEFEKAIPYLEKAIELDANDVYSMESLRSLYLRLKMTDKYDAINEKLNAM